MTSITVTRNVSQRAGQTNRVQGVIINSNTGIFTVPTGKRARVTDIKGVLDTVGADATNAIAIKRFIGGAFEAITNFEVVGVQQSASEVTMESGDILTDIGDAGATNAKFNLSATVEEFSR